MNWRKRQISTKGALKPFITTGCSGAVCRPFDDLQDHAGYVRDGGCGELMDALVAAVGAARA